MNENWQDYAWRSPFSALIYAAADKLALTGSRDEKFRKLLWLRIIYPTPIGYKFVFNRDLYYDYIRVKASKSYYLSRDMMELLDAEERFAKRLTPQRDEDNSKILHYITYKFFDSEGHVMVITSMLKADIKHHPIYASAKSIANEIKWDRRISDLYLHLKRNGVPYQRVSCSDSVHRVFFEHEKALNFIVNNLVDGTHRPGVTRGRLLGKPGKYAC